MNMMKSCEKITKAKARIVQFLETQSLSLKEKRELQKLIKQYEALERKCLESEKGCVRYGVFEWRQDGRYLGKYAQKLYKSKAVAQRYADKRNLVIRTVDICRDTSYIFPSK